MAVLSVPLLTIALSVQSPATAPSHLRAAAASRSGPAVLQQRDSGTTSTLERGRVVPTGSRPTSELSQQLNDMRAQMEQDESTAALMQALRGSNMNDDDFAASDTTMKVVEMRRGDGDDALPTVYDPEALSAYFGKRPGAVLTRVAQVFGASSGWLASVAWDAARGKLSSGSEAEVAAVGRLRGVLVSLGPFFIKLGQALSIRPDILSPQAMVQLQQLCDKVPPFDSELAMATIREDLGCSAVSDVYSKITPEPVAAASLGQVYQATLRSTGEEVAVKVQRPFVLETVSLDLHLARMLGQALRNTPISERIDVVSLLDEFAANFYQELDYELECANGVRCREEMRKIPRVLIPKNYPDFTSRRVHTAEWVVGEKLSQSTADDVGELVNLGVITYLTQLLDTGFFHADPHPGNMLRTPDGQLVILDFGLMCEIDDKVKYGMIEAIAHLIQRDYELIGDDFQNLEFIPEGVDTKPIVPALARVFDAALAGGGAKSINFQELAADLAEITFKFPFRIPPYFALIIRAISVLEGIALVGNPQFAIVDEAYPYISKRLLTDDSPRLREALRYMVYGKGSSFDVERMIDLLQALEKFVAVRDTGDGSAFKVDGIRGGVDVGQAGDAVGTKALVSNAPATTAAAPAPDAAAAAEETAEKARVALQFFFSADGEVVRGFLLDEVVRAADALSRDALAQLLLSPGLSRLPAPPFSRQLASALAPPLTPDDQQVVDNIQRLTAFFLGDLDGADGASASAAAPSAAASTGGNGGGLPGLDNASVQRARALLPVLRENQGEMRAFALQIVGRLTELQASRGLGWVRDRVAAV